MRAIFDLVQLGQLYLHITALKGSHKSVLDSIEMGYNLVSEELTSYNFGLV